MFEDARADRRIDAGAVVADDTVQLIVVVMEAQADLVALNAVDGVDGVFDQVAEHADQHTGGFRVVAFGQQAGFLDGQAQRRLRRRG